VKKNKSKIQGVDMKIMRTIEEKEEQVRKELDMWLLDKFHSRIY
jgi:hypothetical protein